VGDSKRRKLLDPNYGKKSKEIIVKTYTDGSTLMYAESDEPTIENVVEHIRGTVACARNYNNQSFLCALTNNQRGYSSDFINSVREHLKNVSFNLPITLIMLPVENLKMMTVEDPFAGFVLVRDDNDVELF